MKNTLLTLFFLFIFSCLSAQVKLSEKDFENLVTIAETFKENPNGSGPDFKKTLQKLRSQKLNKIIDVLTTINDNSTKILTPKYLNRPTNEELQLWYVLYEINLNMQDDNTNPRDNKVIAKEVLESNIDERVLLNNYYRYLYGNIAKLFNDSDLSNINLETEKYHLKNDTEKAIFFFRITEPLIVRFMVLSQMKNPDQLYKFAKKMPKVNGEEYYKFTSFSIEDFEFFLDGKMTSFMEHNMNRYYNCLASHFWAAGEKEDFEKVRDIYYKSILYKPEYFKYYSDKKSLEKLYESSKK